MSRQTPDFARTSPPAQPSARGDRRPSDEPRGFLSASAIRETIESLAIAFVLAFLFRTFEAEAFVIPTGSMAPTLMGRHKDLSCPMCGAPYQLSASDEVDANGASRRDNRGGFVAVQTGACPMCRYTANLFRDFGGYPRSYNGDRILVDKLAYDFHEPKRWDVIVFHYPNEATTNYIKRLIGLPGETVRIQNGDIWTQRDEAAGFQIERKPPSKLLAMLQPVFDNDYMPAIARYGWPQRWTPENNGESPSWQSANLSEFSIEAGSRGEQWLRYRHRIPSYEQWDVRTYKQWQDLKERSATAEPADVQEQWIKDFTAFNTSREHGQGPSPTVGGHWVGDLAVECTANVESNAGSLALELRKGGRNFQCRFDLATGWATLSISGQGMATATAKTAVHGKGTHRIRFSNCDNEMLLWVDDAVVRFDKPTRYEDLGNVEPTQDDLTPAGIGVAGAAARISHVRLFRDIYYISLKGDAPHGRVGPEWSRVDFRLGADQFFMLGDNSSNSQDGRLWGGDYWVDRRLLIGQAMFIYWPHSWYYLPVLDLPLWPNIARMGIVR
ncbi:MAG: signal peptidase I [Thermoguttaceae bacterium]